MDYIQKFPETPEQPVQPTILLMLTYEQATAIRDAVTCFGMAVDGELDAIRETYAKSDGPDMGAANTMADDAVRLAYEVHHMIDQQQQPYIKKFRDWWRAVRHRYER
jgi:hypothetical protein